MVKASLLSLLRAQVNPWWGNQEPTSFVVWLKQNQTQNVIFLVSYGYKCVFPGISGSQPCGLTGLTRRCKKILISGLPEEIFLTSDLKTKEDMNEQANIWEGN